MSSFFGLILEEVGLDLEVAEVELMREPSCDVKDKVVEDEISLRPWKFVGRACGLWSWVSFLEEGMSVQWCCQEEEETCQMEDGNFHMQLPT